MVAVGLSREDIIKMLPEGIYVACDNSSSNVTLSGPEKPTRIFMEELQAKGIFVKLVNSGNITFHSKYIQEAADLFLDYLKEVIVEPKRRSSKWISTSVPLEKQSETWGQYCSPEYYANNSCGEVLFNSVYRQIPKNAILIEIGPHGLLLSIFRRELFG